jgi:tripartite-type tricarboxylate transporter receptor subunit TctC
MLTLPEVIGAVREGRVVALGIAQDHRSPLLPEVPTLQEQGIPLVLQGYRGFAVPVGMPAARLAALAEALRAAVADPEFTDQAEAHGHVPRFLGPAIWEPMLRKARAELTARWIRAPWLERQDRF